MADDAVARVREALKRAAEAQDSQGQIPAIQLALDEIARGLARLAEGERNLAFQQALLDERLLRVERNRLFTAFNRVVSSGSNLLTRIHGAPADVSAPEESDPEQYARWIAHESAALPSVQSARDISKQWSYRPLISLLMSASGPGALRGSLDSFRDQAYENWELCIAVRQGCEPLLSDLQDRLHSFAEEGLGYGEVLNRAAALASGDYLCIVPDTGTLSPLALYHIGEALQETKADLLYADEDSLDSGRRINPVFKPDWSPELLTSAMYVGNMLAIRRETWLQLGGLSNESSEAWLLDFVLRLSDQQARIHHVRRVLFHKRRDLRIPEAEGKTIAQTIERREGVEAVADRGPAPGTWITRRKAPIRGMTAIICSRSPGLLQECLASLRATSNDVIRQIIVVAHEDAGPREELQSVIQRAGAQAIPFHGPFDFAVMNNLAAGGADSPNLLFLNDDVRATEAGWAELLDVDLSRKEIGIAGAVLWYPTGTLQHAGIVVGIGDGVGHVGRYQYGSRLWPWLLAKREVSAVTGACLAIRKELFDSLGGFDTLFPNNYNDVDLCFRARSIGYRVICVPVPRVIHAECQSRPGVVRFEERYRFFQRWLDLLGRPDPYYSRSLASTEKIALNLSDGDWYRGLIG